jgi:DNA-binding winged helix-turn-helix (wHTH) protein/tetratricopeptide (TPR) repeat protein
VGVPRRRRGNCRLNFAGTASSIQASTARRTRRSRPAPFRIVTVPLATSQTYRFGAFEIDAACRELRRNGTPVELPSKPFSCVVYLIENRHRVVDRDELMRAVWGHVHLTESVLGQAIRLARQVFGDSGEDQQVIKTVRGFGYRWAAPVVEAGAKPRAESAAVAHEPRTSRWRRFALLAIALVAALMIARSKRDAILPVDAVPPSPSSEPIALLLPVAGASNPDDAWIRLGLMEYIANRLRADGQPMVPTDSVILLLHGMTGTPDANALQALTASTQARVVLEAEAERNGAEWRVSLHTSGDTQPAVAASGHGPDILAAARRAADDVAIALGRVPVADPDAPPDLALLGQRIHAAMLTQNRALAQKLIDGAPPELRSTPEIRFQQARIDFYEHEGAKAEAAFAALIDETPAEKDPVLRARALNGLAVARIVRSDRAGAEPMLEEAARLVEHNDSKALRDTQGTIWMNLGNIAQERGDLDLAGERMARARRMFEATGDVRNLAQLELNVGVLETRRDRYAESLRRFESAARLHNAIHDAGDELKALCFIVQANMRLLDPAAAEPHAPRIAELLQSTTDADLAGLAKLSLFDLDDAAGREKLAERLLDEVLATIPPAGDVPSAAIDALAARAERAADAHDWTTAEHAAGELIARQKRDCNDPEAPNLDRAMLVLVRSRIAAGALEAASQAAANLPSCADEPGGTAKIQVALAAAELAAAAGQRDATTAAFDRALALADESRTPVRVREVVERYVEWLVADDAAREDTLLRVSERVAGFADRDYATALIQLRVYRKLGPPGAWQTALARAQRLAGERRIPAHLMPSG